MFASARTNQDDIAYAWYASSIQNDVSYARASDPCVAVTGRTIVLGEDAAMSPLIDRLGAAVAVACVKATTRIIMGSGALCCLGAIAMATLPGVGDVAWFWALVAVFSLSMCVLPILRAFDTLPKGNAQTHIAEE
jgi:hypothetical protein